MQHWLHCWVRKAGKMEGGIWETRWLLTEENLDSRRRPSGYAHRVEQIREDVRHKARLGACSSVRFTKSHASLLIDCRRAPGCPVRSITLAFGAKVANIDGFQVA